MPSHKPKRTPPLAVGFTVLMLQALTMPFVIVGALRNLPAQPQALTGLFLALGLGSTASLAMLGWGMRVGNSTARVAPAVLVLPAWLLVAALAPTQASGADPGLYAIVAIAMGLVTSTPFLTANPLRLFSGDDRSGL